MIVKVYPKNINSVLAAMLRFKRYSVVVICLWVLFILTIKIHNHTLEVLLILFLLLFITTLLLVFIFQAIYKYVEFRDEELIVYYKSSLWKKKRTINIKDIINYNPSEILIIDYRLSDTNHALISLFDLDKSTYSWVVKYLEKRNVKTLEVIKN